MENLQSKIFGIIKDTFNRQDIDVSRSTMSSDIPEWDSLKNVEIILAIEQIFCIEFNLNDLKNIKNVGMLIDLIQQKVPH